MPNNNTPKIIICIFALLIIGYVFLFYLNRNKVPTLNKKMAICLCKSIMYFKVDKNINDLLVKQDCEIKNNNVKVTLIFKHNENFVIKNKDITTAYCIFNLQYIHSQVWLKSFFYQDLSSNLYIYNDVNIKIKNIKTCELK